MLLSLGQTMLVDVTETPVLVLAPSFGPLQTKSERVTFNPKSPVAEFQV
ncbi:hypothetical protein GALL_458860 [mine drainage metagenome]|uniref:Uncharacterized protein n=1 Tax=mine drainage metagenome TaxID=410659 RepID=A0A1J5PLS5_9ZZZZ